MGPAEPHRRSEAKVDTLAAFSAQTLLDVLPSGAVLVDESDLIVATNRRAAELIGYNPATSIGRRVDGALRGCLERAARMVAAGEESSFELFFNGGWYVIQVFVMSTQGRSLRCVVAHDVSRRKAEEFQIRENEARLEEATRIAHLGTFKLVWDSGEVLWSPHMYILHDVSTETHNPTSDDYFAFVHPDDHETVRRILRDARSGKALSGAEYRIVRRDKMTRWIRLDGRVLFDADGAPYASFGVCQDITETKNREQELNDLLRRNATLYEALEASPIGVAVLTPEPDVPSFFYVNAEFQRLTLHNGFSLRGARPGGYAAGR